MLHLSNFDPNNVATEDNGIFGLPHTEEEAELIIIPVPWEVTVSYRLGTSRASEKIFDASKQIDLYDADAPNMWKHGYHLQELDHSIREKNDYLRHCAELIISNLMDGGHTKEHAQLQEKLDEINKAGYWLKNELKNKALNLLKSGKRVALLGGDHSTPLGFIEAICEHYGEIGILQIDAHADLRVAYEGFIYSHASIMYNALNTIPNVKKIVQVGIRDYCDSELEMIQNSNGRIQTFFDQDIKRRLYSGDTWKNICNEIVDALPEKVYISFDIDGLDPKLCSNTGTPVPGGFETEEVYYLFTLLLEKGKKIVAFDLNEVSTGEHTHDGIDALVGARVLYKMCNLATKSHYS